MQKKIMIRALVLFVLIITSISFCKDKTKQLSQQYWYQTGLPKEAFHYDTYEQGSYDMVLHPQPTDISLNCLYACLMDADSHRVLFEKEMFKEVPMASTTKIMTLLVVLENADLSEIVTISKNAARQPDVQLNVNTGEQYKLEDLCYSLMLESHNDTAVAIAEHVGKSVEGFCKMMTDKAKEIGAYHTSFATPNGLDAQGHYTTAYDLSLIAAYAIQNKEFCKIIQTSCYQFDEINHKRSFSVTNKNRFLYMMEGALGIKTGFTNKAGYCFVGGLQVGNKTLISTVLGSGWPPHKEYKWSDTRKLMSYGLNEFESYRMEEKINKDENEILPEYVTICGGKKDTAKITADFSLEQGKIMLKPEERLSKQVCLNRIISAPCSKNEIVGSVTYYIDEKCYHTIPITITEDIKKSNIIDFFKKLIQI